MSGTEFIESVGRVVDLIGVAIVAIGSIAALVPYLWRLATRAAHTGDYRATRLQIGRAILLGLEFLIAGDIIRSVAVSPTFESVGVLGLIVLVRTFLSFSLSVELEGRWPWQSGPAPEGTREG